MLILEFYSPPESVNWVKIPLYCGIQRKRLRKVTHLVFQNLLHTWYQELNLELSTPCQLYSNFEQIIFLPTYPLCASSRRLMKETSQVQNEIRILHDTFLIVIA